MGRYEICELLLANGSRVEAYNEYKSQALHLAAQWNHPDVCRLLLDNGAMVDARTKVNWTPLHVACREGNVADYQQFQMTYHVDSLLIPSLDSVNVPITTSYNQHSLHFHCYHPSRTGHIAVVKVLLDHGKADLQALTSFGSSPLHLAVKVGKDARYIHQCVLLICAVDATDAIT